MDYCHIAQVSTILVFVEVAVRRVSLGRLVGWLGVTLETPEDDQTTHAKLRPEDVPAQDLRRVYLTRKLLRYWPFGSGPCLRESLVLGYVLRRYQPVLRLGVAREDGVISAHAWLEVAGVSLEADRGFLPLESRPESANLPIPPQRP